MIRKLVCFFLGHRRGKFHSLIREQGSDKVIARMILCPRCESTWMRKVK